ncbi:MAG TPA: hypothetical protein VMT35_16525 [Ignavibacteriaceae bacterium]|nr:hypothetical protein [Ignavibacteriaceae bacterium]
MNKASKYIILSSILPIIFFINAAVPAFVLGCPTRGLIAAVIAVVCVCLALFSAIKGVLSEIEAAQGGEVWILSCIILALPAFYIVVIA